MTPIDKVLDALRYTGTRNLTEYKCHCPAHDDNHESLSVAEGKDSKVLLHCFANCTVDAIVKAAGLEITDLFADAPKPKRAKKSGSGKQHLGPILATYDYTDETGNLLYQATRHNPKDFRQRQPNGKGGWIWSITKPPVRRVLYRLPELLAADPAQWVFIVEGEKDVHSLVALDLTATCNAMGAGKWDDAYTEQLRGRRVVILPDNDNPGRKHAHDVANRLQGIAASVRVVELPDLPVKGDVSDWLGSGGIAAQLAELVEAAPEWTPASAPVATAKFGMKPKSEMLLDALGAMGRTFRLNRLEDNVEVDGKRLDDITLSGINLKLVDEGFSRPSIADAINVFAGRNAYDPVEDYLLGLQWDEQNHLAKMMDYFTGDGTVVNYGKQSAPLHLALIEKWMCGAVARGLNRGAGAFSHQTPMLVVIGPQGIGKSSWARWLTSGIGYEYHRESMVNPHGIEDMRSMVTKWIWEVSELGSSLRRGDRDSLKAFITQEWHTYRKPWGKHQITKPTLCNFIGTLNPETGFLDDPTGHRRFLPVVINAIDHGYKDTVDINQVWAQVVSLYRTGKISPELHKAERNALANVYKEHEVENPLATYINMYFTVDPDNPTMKCHTAAIIQRLTAFGIRLSANHKVAGRELNDVLVPMGLNNAGGKPFRANGVLGRGWLGIHPNNVPTPP